MSEIIFKLKELEKEDTNFIRRSLKSKVLFNLCKKSIPQSYIADYLKFQFDHDTEKYILYAYQGSVDNKVGFAILFFHDTDIPYSEIMIICSNTTQKGVGSKLLQEAEKIAKKSDMEYMVLCSLNTPFGFYKKFGYQIANSRICDMINKDNYEDFDPDLYEYYIKMDKAYRENQMAKGVKLKDIEELENFTDDENSQCPFNSDDGCVYMYKKL